MQSPRFVSAYLAGACLLAFSSHASAQILTKTLTYSRFSGPPDNVRQVQFTYNAGLGTTSFSGLTTITSTPGADGILFAPDADIIVGGQADAIHKIAGDGSFATVTAGGVFAFHVMLDPSGTKVWASAIPGFLVSVPLNPFANGTMHFLSGDDPLITHVGFAPNGKAYYSASYPTGNGNFGRIDLNTFTTTQMVTNVPWAHGICFDCYSGHIIAFANNTIAQIDPATDSVVATLDLSPLGLGLEMDQGTSDGEGHLFIASNTGHMVFLDITGTQRVDMPVFVDAPFLEAGLDDLAPDCGLGSPPAFPFSPGYWKNHPAEWPLTSLTLGCQTYTQAQCLTLMNTPPRGDASLILARQLIGAKLNVANNGLNWPTVAALAAQADVLLCNYTGNLPYRVKSNTVAGQQMVAIANQLALLVR